MNRRALPHEVRALLERLPRWWPRLVGWSVGWVNHGPRWLPLVVRKVPLQFTALVCSIYRRGWL